VAETHRMPYLCSKHLFSAKDPRIRAQFAERDLQDKAYYGREVFANSVQRQNEPIETHPNKHIRGKISIKKGCHEWSVNGKDGRNGGTLVLKFTT